jgi:hypothetical protein
MDRAAVRQCGSVRKCYRQCVAVRTVVCASVICGSALGSSVWQCARHCQAVQRWGSARQCGSVHQCGCPAVRQCGSAVVCGSVAERGSAAVLRQWRSAAVCAAVCGSCARDMCVSVWQCVTVCGSVAVCGSVWQCVAMCDSARGCVWQCTLCIFYNKLLTTYLLVCPSYTKGVVGLSPVFLTS